MNLTHPPEDITSTSEEKKKHWKENVGDAFMAGKYDEMFPPFEIKNKYLTER